MDLLLSVHEKSITPSFHRCTNFWGFHPWVTSYSGGQSLPSKVESGELSMAECSGDWASCPESFGSSFQSPVTASSIQPVQVCLPVSIMKIAIEQVRREQG